MKKIVKYLYILSVFASYSNLKANSFVPKESAMSISGEYECNYPNDESRGISIVRAIFRVNDSRGCFLFYRNDYSSYEDDMSCGKYAGTFKKNFIVSAKFIGYFDFTKKSRTSIPEAQKKRFAQFTLDRDGFPNIMIWSDHRHSYDIQFVCKKR